MLWGKIMCIHWGQNGHFLRVISLLFIQKRKKLSTPKWYRLIVKVFLNQGPIHNWKHKVLINKKIFLTFFNLVFPRFGTRILPALQTFPSLLFYEEFTLHYLHEGNFNKGWLNMKFFDWANVKTIALLLYNK